MGKTRLPEEVKKKVKKDDKASRSKQLVIEGAGCSADMNESDYSSSSDEDPPAKKPTKAELAKQKENRIVDKQLKLYQRNTDLSVLSFVKQTNETIEKMGKSVIEGIRKALEDNLGRLSERSTNLPPFAPRFAYPSPHEDAERRRLLIDRSHYAESAGQRHRFNDYDAQMFDDYYGLDQPRHSGYRSTNDQPRHSGYRSTDDPPLHSRIMSRTNESNSRSPSPFRSTRQERCSSQSFHASPPFRASEAGKSSGAPAAKPTIDYTKMLEIRKKSTSNSSLAVGLLLYLFKEDELTVEGVTLEGVSQKGSKTPSIPLSPNRVGHLRTFCLDNPVSGNDQKKIWQDCRNGIHKKLSALKSLKRSFDRAFDDETNEQTTASTETERN